MASGSSDYVSLHEAAEHLGVHYMTVYRYVRLGMLPAIKVAGSWRIERSDLALHGTPSGTPGRRSAPWSSRIRLRMLAGDVEGSWHVVEAAMASGVGPADIYVDVLGPALHEIGALWRQGAIGIEQEHLATGVATSIVGRMGPRFRRRGRPRGSVVIALPVGERHGLGAAMVADILRGAGYWVLNLGPDTPPASVAGAIGDAGGLSAVLVSVVDASHLAAAAETVSAARRADPAAVVIAGGFAIPDAAVARSIGADDWTGDPRRLGDLIDELRARR